jgi:hypothetical protein
MRCPGLILFFLLIAGRPSASAQLVFAPVAGGVPITLPHSLFDSSLNDSIEIDVLRCYIGPVELLQGGKPVYRLQRPYFLIDADVPASMQLALPGGIRYDSLRFGLGVDSLTSVSGVFSGDLDPVNGMYWTWQSGYINFKMEGSSQKMKTLNGRFQFHVGGYLPPFNTRRTIQVAAGQDGRTLVRIDIPALLKRINLAQTPVLMSPGEKAVEFADKLTAVFKSGF